MFVFRIPCFSSSYPQGYAYPRLSATALHTEMELRRLTV